MSFMCSFCGKREAQAWTIYHLARRELAYLVCRDEKCTQEFLKPRHPRSNSTTGLWFGNFNIRGNAKVVRKVAS